MNIERKNNLRVIFKILSLDDYESDCIIKRNDIERKKVVNWILVFVKFELIVVYFVVDDYFVFGDWIWEEG